MKIQEGRVTQALGKRKGIIAGVGAGVAAGAYANHKARQRFDRNVDKEVHMRKVRYAQIRESGITREDVIEALIAEMTPQVNIAKGGTPATQAAREIFRERMANQGKKVAVGGASALAVGAGALALRARAQRKKREQEA